MTARPRRLTALFVAALASAPVVARGAERPSKAPVDPIVIAAPKDFAAAVEALERATGVKGEAIRPENTPEVPLAEGRSFGVDARTAERILAGSHTAFRRAGLYVFRYDRSYGLEGEKDHLGLLATADPFEVIRRMGTAGPSTAVTPDAIVAWVRDLAKDEPLELVEIGADYVTGRFARAPKDPTAIARRAIAFAPDLAAGHKNLNPLTGIADMIGRNRTLLLIWH